MAGSIAGAFLSGEKPRIPEYSYVDIGHEQVGAVRDNLRALPLLQTLTSRVNEFSADELAKNLERVFPGYGQILAKGTETLQSQMRGEIPEDVARAVSQASAEKSRAGGYSGSGFGDSLEARDLGLTSLDIINRSLSTAERWMNSALARAPQFDHTRMFISPQERINVKLFENSKRFERDLMKARVDAMPEPWETALKNLFDNVEESGQAALGAYAGGQMGGGGMGGGGGGGGGSSPAWAYEGSTSYQAGPTMQLNDTSGTYWEPAVQSYNLPPSYFDSPGYNAPVSQHQWGGT